MKKSLLLLGALAVAASASAITPHTYTNFYGMQLSPNGRYFSSYIYGSISVVDTETGKVVAEYESDECYEGNGKTISNSGWLVGGPMDGVAGILINDEWVELELPYGVSYAGAQAITPDNRFICGYASTPGSDIMMLPMIWEMLEDGSYSKGIVLPYPKVDPVTNKTPQYILPVCMSDDGKHLFGQMVDESGMLLLPVAFELDENNEWGYTFPGIELFNPLNLTIGEYPGDFEDWGAVYPQPQDYMTEQQWADYQQSIDDYYNAGGWNSGLDYPTYTDFMTPEKAAEYEEACDKYNEIAAAYNEALGEYFDSFYGIIDNSPALLQNNVVCSPDGKQVVYDATFSVYTGWFAEEFAAPMQVNMAAGEAEQWSPELNLYCHGITNDGIVIAHTDANPWSGLPIEAYIKKADDEKFTSMVDYLLEQDPELEYWIEHNLEHEFIEYVENWEEDIYEEVYVKKVAFGRPTVSEDLSTIISCQSVLWDDAPWEDYYYTYVFTGLTSGVNNVAVDGKDLAVTSLGKGVLGVSAPATLEVYNLNGARVFSAITIGGTVETGLGAGVYVVKATATNGSTTVAKLAF